jgi:hypothetical protein
MVKPPKNLEAFKLALQKEKISLVTRQNDSGIIYGLTYIDHNTKCVFNGSDIGKEYSAKAILEKCGIPQTFSVQDKPIETKILETTSLSSNPDHNKRQDLDLLKIIEGIVSPSDELQYVPHQLRKRKRKNPKSD